MSEREPRSREGEVPEGAPVDRAKKEELGDAALMFESVIRESPLAITVFDRDSRVMVWNPAAERLLGWSAEEVLGNPPPMIPDESRREIEIVNAAALEGDTLTGIETRALHKDGDIFDVTLSTAPFYDGFGRINGAMAVLVDISERKRAEEVLGFLSRISAELTLSLSIQPILDRLAELSLPILGDFVAIDLFDDDDRLQRVAALHADPELAWLAERLRDYPPVDRMVRRERRGRARSRHAGKGPGADTPPRVTQPTILYEVPDSWIVQSVRDLEHLRLMRQLAPRSIMIVPLVARGRTLGILTLAITTTRPSYGIRDLELAQEVARRAATAIENARLYEETEEAVRSRDEVMAIVSHDLRNPINTISMTAQLLEERLTDEEDKRLLDVISRSTARMEKLIRDLLDIARIEAGAFTIEPRDTDPGELVREAVQLQQPLARESSIDLKAELPRELPTIPADRERVLQVFQNIIENALRFTPEGGSVTVRAQEVPEGVRFTVQDTGSGIEPDVLPHLFDRFWQARKSARGGAGIGLSIARGIVEAHGGQIEAESTPGVGTSISFTLPSS